MNEDQTQTTDYAALSPPAFLAAMGDDPSKWAEAFVQIAATLGHPGIDEGWMIGWFANAIGHSCDVRRWREEGTL